MHVVNKVEHMIIVRIFREVFDGGEVFLLTSDAIVIRLRKFYHILDVLLCRAVEGEKAHLIRPLFKRSCLEIIFNFTVFAAMLAKKLPHLLGNHVLRIRVYMGKRD